MHCLHIKPCLLPCPSSQAEIICQGLCPLLCRNGCCNVDEFARRDHNFDIDNVRSIKLKRAGTQILIDNDPPEERARDLTMSVDAVVKIKRY